MLGIIEGIIWSIAIVLLVGGGLYFTFNLGFIQFKFKDMFNSFRHDDNEKITPFKSLTLALAARIGVGSLAGIALSIYLGGSGTIFWIWISAIITSVNSFSESLLGIKYRMRDDDVYKGGPSYYMDKALNNKTLARIYAVLIIVAYIVGFMTIQANTIATSIKDYIGIDPLVIGVILAILTFLSITKGVKRIANLTSKLVPLMGSVYIFLSVFIFITNFDKLGYVLTDILNNAFNFKSFGFGVISAFIIGIQRGVFSTEAGLGSGAIASSTADEDKPVKMGLIQILGIYFTSFIVCTSTAFIILTSDYQAVDFGNINGIELTQYALNYHLGDLGIIILVFSILSFAFSTIISGYYYGESNLKYLYSKTNKKHLLLLKIVTVVLLIAGSVVNSSILWKLVDIFVALMAIINMYALLSLRKIIKKEVLIYKNK